MNLRDFSNKELSGNKDYVTNGDVLLSKENIKCKNLFDKFYFNRIKNVFDIGFEDKLNSCIPFEKGVFVNKKRMKIIGIDYKMETFYIFSSYASNMCFCFSKEYIDFIEKYLDVYTYSIVKNENERHLLKFWGYNNEFLGCLAPVNLVIGI